MRRTPARIAASTTWDVPTALTSWNGAAGVGSNTWASPAAWITAAALSKTPSSVVGHRMSAGRKSTVAGNRPR
ncbi:MAG: hypothetical protein NUV77_01890 [Thermoguttaceae bacterium]|nr:hypothetical protein [Thermoguttaceae bacterium]